MKILLVSLFFLTSLFSHKLNLFISQEDNSVYASAYFASGGACQNCELKVLDEKGNILEEAKTDLKGEYIITKLSSKIFVEVEASEGHGAKDSLVIKNIVKKETSSTELEELKKQNQKLKTKVKMLEEKIEQNELLKMFFALLVIAGIFFFLKRVKKDA